jgi:hypothetical protein
MRVLLLLLLLPAFACSSRAAGPTADPPTVLIPTAPSAAPSATPSDAGAPAVQTPRPIVRLPDQPYDALVPVYRTIDWAAGEIPGPAFPSGTVYIATRDPTSDDPVSVTEWDLARAAIVRTTVLPISTRQPHPWMLRVGDHLHVLANGRTSRSYVQLSKDLRVEHVESWIGQIPTSGVDAFSADDTLTAVSYVGTADKESVGPNDLLVVTFDASGRRMATAAVQRPDPGESLVDAHAGNMVVLGGRVFVVICRFDVGVELLRLGPTLHVEKRILVDREADFTVRLGTHDGRLQLSAGYPDRRAIEFTTSLQRLGPAAPVEETGLLELGDEKVDLCGHQGRAWLAWSTTPEDACASSPAYLLADRPPEWP